MQVLQVLLSVADSTYRNQLSSAVLKLQESGKLAKMKNRWWKEERGGGRCAVSYSHVLKLELYVLNFIKTLSLITICFVINLISSFLC